MAVVAPPPSKENSGLWGLRPPSHSLDRTHTMPFQYPPPPSHNGSEAGTTAAGNMPTHTVPPQALAGIAMRDTGLPAGQPSGGLLASNTLKRTASIPFKLENPRLAPRQTSSAPDQAAFGLSGEKKRNKLGYHRTSVACGHCRKRKIRCVPLQDDHQGRCVNCVRLKKDCTFFPVDQPQPLETRQKTASQSSVGAPATSTSSSPAMRTGPSPKGHGQHVYAPVSMSMPTSGSSAKVDPGSEDISAGSQVPSTTIARPYQFGQHGMPNWMTSDPMPNQSEAGDVANNWRPYPAASPLTPTYSPYTPQGLRPPTAWTATDGNARDGINWASYPAPTPRSMSFGADHVVSQHQHPPTAPHNSSPSSRGYGRRLSAVSTDVYSPAIATSVSRGEPFPDTCMEQTMASSAGVAPPIYGWQPSNPYPKAPNSYGDWIYGADTAHQLEGGGQHAPQQAGPNMYYGR